MVLEGCSTGAPHLLSGALDGDVTQGVQVVLKCVVSDSTLDRLVRVIGGGVQKIQVLLKTV
jgi:hypothetical protein